MVGIIVVNKLNKNLKRIKSKLYFEKFEKDFAYDLAKKKNKILLNKTLEDIFTSIELYRGEKSDKFHHNKQEIEKLKSEEYGKALEVMESQPDKYSAIDIHDTRNFKHELDKRVEAMLTWHLSFNQSLFRIRDIQDANIAHSNSISQDIDNMMPMLRDQLQQAVYLYNLEQGLKAHEVMINGFNEILTHNADATHDLKVRVTQMTESPSIKLETLKHNQEKIKETTRDCLRIIDEAAKQRLNNEREMAKMREELDSMMSGVSISKNAESAVAIEAKYSGASSDGAD